MPALQQLVLDGNNLAGSLPLSWGAAGSMEALSLLSLTGNALSGQLPGTWCNGAQSLPALKVGLIPK